MKKRLVALESKAAAEGWVLTEAQVAALEKKQDDDLACGEIETHHPGYLGSQDTFYVGTLKGVGRIYQQTFVDTYSKVAQCKLYPTKTPITAAELLNDRVLPMLEEHGMSVLRMLTDRGTEYCGRVESHDYELYLAVNKIEHTKTKAFSLQTNGICERFHKTILHEFYHVAFRKKIYETLDELQKDLDDWLQYYNYERTHQGKMCCGRTHPFSLYDFIGYLIPGTYTICSLFYLDHFAGTIIREKISTLGSSKIYFSLTKFLEINSAIKLVPLELL